MKTAVMMSSQSMARPLFGKETHDHEGHSHGPVEGSDSAKADTHVHGPNCNHDHGDHSHDSVQSADTFQSKESVYVHGPDCEHDHEAVKTKPGDHFKNPVLRAVTNFFGWFYELGAGFVKDLLGKKPDEVHDHHHDHDHEGHEHHDHSKHAH